MSDITVTIDWVRHGFSCANILQHTSMVTNILRPLITQDAALSDIGVRQAAILNEKVLSSELKDRYDIICCSHLRRAMETALFAFNNPDKAQNLVVVPYISEVRQGIARALSLDRENQSLGIDELIKHWDELKPIFNFNVDFSIINNQKFSDYANEDYDKFIKFVLPEIISKIDEKNKPGDGNYKIVIVSHNHFIRQHIEKNHNITDLKELKNTEMWREKFNFVINDEKIGVIKEYINSDTCDNETCQIYPGKNPSCGEISMDRCKKFQHTLYNKFVPDTINIEKCELPEKQSQNGGSFYYHKYIKYKQKYLLLSKLY